MLCGTNWLNLQKLNLESTFQKMQENLHFHQDFPYFATMGIYFKGKKLLVVANTWVEIMELGIPQLFEGQYLGPI